MRKFKLIILTLMLSGGLMAQPVVDNAIIPVSVTLNSILRLNVTSGGNIEFTVNTLDQYTNGIANSDRYDTEFTVASSVDYDVLLYAEDGTFIGSDDAGGGHTLALDNVGYSIAYAGDATIAVGTDMNLEGLGVDPSAVVPVVATTTHECVTSTGGNAGDINQNKYIINWELGTGSGTMNGTSLLSQNLAADRYSTNVFLVLAPH